MICTGIDAGSRAIKVVLIDADNLEIMASAVTDQGIEQGTLARVLFERLLKDNRLSRNDVETIVATGYGRNNVSIADTTVTELTCHARGVRKVAPEAMTIIEIGGQDSKLIRLGDDGLIRDFAMNDRCAGGTGRFLEMVAMRLNLELGELGDVAAKSRKPAVISSMCVVFAETEIIGLLADGGKLEDIVAGVQNAVATRVIGMAGRNVTAPVVLTGGVAMIPGMAAAFESALGQPVTVAPEPQMTGALGAAILAAGRRQ